MFVPLWLADPKAHYVPRVTKAEGRSPRIHIRAVESLLLRCGIDMEAPSTWQLF